MLVAGGLALLGCGGSGPSAAASITSDDGKATLTLAEGALPDGMNPGDVSLTRFDPAPADVFVVGYRLEPDGTVLNTPATLAIDTFDELWSGGLVLHVSQSDVESPEPTVVFDDVFGTLRGLEVPVSHFSDLMLIPPFFLNPAIIIQPLLGTVPSATTSATIQVSRNPSGEWWYPPNRQAITTWTDQFAWAPKVTWTTTNLIEDRTEENYPSSVVEFLDLSHSWSCVRKGVITANFKVEAWFMASYGSHGIERNHNFEVTTTSNLCFEEEPINDAVTSVSTSAPTAPVSDIDINGAAGGATQLNGSDAAQLSNSSSNFERTSGFKSSHYECGSSTPEMTVVCPEGVQPMPAGEVFMYGMRLELPPAGDSTYRYIYSAVVDSDGEDANDWRVQGPYDWDLFQGTDRWYQLERAVGGTWSLTVSQVDANQNIGAVAQSTVRAVIQNDVILFYISATEMSVPAPGYRMTSFKDRGNFDFADLAADVSGTDPTQALDITVRPDM